MATVLAEVSTYDEVAAEYYDSSRHPTCANFWELSNAFLVPRIQRLASAPRILEVGCGRSIAAAALAEGTHALNALTLIDQSPRMLAHSLDWKTRGAQLKIADAQATGLNSNNYQLLVSSLGDPYNGQPFWNEVYRLLTAGGVCLFTTPSREWAERLRAKSELSVAEFLRADGVKIFVRSEISDLDEQIEMIERSGLRVDEIRSFTAADISGRRSPKLLVTEHTLESVIVRGFSISKQA